MPGVRLPHEKAVSVVESVSKMLKNLNNSTKREWQVLLGKMNFVAQISEEAKFRKKS